MILFRIFDISVRKIKTMPLFLSFKQMHMVLLTKFKQRTNFPAKSRWRLAVQFGSITVIYL